MVNKTILADIFPNKPVPVTVGGLDTNRSPQSLFQNFPMTTVLF